MVKALWPFLLMSIFSAHGFGKTTSTISTLSNDACWFNYSEGVLKVSSFNEGTSFSRDFESLLSSINDELTSALSLKENLFIKNVGSSLHCGSYGHSVVFQVDSSLGKFCLWAKLSNQKLEFRSVGSLDINFKDGLCHGRKVGEFLIGVHSNFKKEDFIKDYSEYILDFDEVRAGIFKLTLKEEYQLKEDWFKEKLELEHYKGLRFIEFNEFRHPIGEYSKIGL